MLLYEEVDYCVTADPHQDWRLSRECCTSCQDVSEQRKGEEAVLFTLIGKGLRIDVSAS